MGRTLAIMVTMTTYGTWLRGDRRGWVEDGVIWPSDPELEGRDRRRMKHSVFVFDRGDVHRVGEAIGTALVERLGVTVLALTVQTWHVHAVIGATEHDVSRVVKCVKDAGRYALRAGRPIWTEGYDKRFCFDAGSVMGRVGYVERHNEREGMGARPWGFVVDARGYLRGCGI